MTPTLQDLNGELVVAAPYQYSDQPQIVVNYWPTGIRTADFKRNYEYVALPAELHDNGGGQGSYSLLRGLGIPALTVRLIDGGRTQSVKQEIVAVPCPKVRKGIETRYRAGRWEKYLKPQGWVSA